MQWWFFEWFLSSCRWSQTNSKGLYLYEYHHRKENTAVLVMEETDDYRLYLKSRRFDCRLRDAKHCLQVAANTTAGQLEIHMIGANNQ